MLKADTDVEIEVDCEREPARDERFLRALGDVAYYSGWLEHLLGDLLIEINRGSSTLALIADLSFTNLMHATRASLNEIAVDCRPTRYLNACLDRAQHAYEWRNKMIHGLWFASKRGPDCYVAIRRRARGKVRRFIGEYHLDDITGFAAGLNDAGVRIGRFMNSKTFKSRKMFVLCPNCGHQH